MVLVGIRIEGNSTRYLVQNGWKKKTFVEMDELVSTLFRHNKPLWVPIQVRLTITWNAICWTLTEIVDSEMYLNELKGINALAHDVFSDP